jgi:sulfatase modifying factor 1
MHRVVSRPRLQQMAQIPIPDAGTIFTIDVTEVTRGQYDGWLATNPALPSSTDSSCGWNVSFAEQGTGYAGTDAAHHPVVYVDWCDAYAYCSSVGKRLCGAIPGGSADWGSSWSTENASQWQCACSSGGTHRYPYGDTYQPSYCNGAEFNTTVQQTVVVGSLQYCVIPTSGLGAYDLVGNVAEWADMCDAVGPFANCQTHGGDFTSDERDLGYGCGLGGPHGRSTTFDYVGFHYCSK